MTAAGREIDAEDAVEQISARHGVAIAGDYPRYGARPHAQGTEHGSPWLDAWLTDLIYAQAIRSIALCFDAAGEPAASDVTSLRIDEFLALHRGAGLAPRQWYRVHAPAGYSCRPSVPPHAR